MVANQPQAGQQKEVHRLDFFRPDQLVCLVTHETAQTEPLSGVTLGEWVTGLSQQMSQNEKLSGTSARAFVGGLCEQLNDAEHLPKDQLDAWTVEFAKQMDAEGWHLVDPQPRSYTFPPVNSLEDADQSWQELYSDAVSLIVCNVEKNEQPDIIGAQQILSRFGVFAMDRDEPDQTNDDQDPNDNKVNEERATTKIHLFDLIQRLNQPETIAKLTFAGLTMRAVTPNWIVSSAKSDSGGTGGPGSNPTPYTDSLDPVPYSFESLKDQLGGNNLNQKNFYGDGKVDVIILDTAPSIQDLVLAHKELVLIPEKEGRPVHQLLKNLLGPNGRLKLYPATYEEQLRMGNTSLNKRGYKMDDHGLFIGGIIHSIVPSATIHLIEVLNQFGVGDLETLARGLAKAYAIALEHGLPTVVSASWMLDLPAKQKGQKYRQTDKEMISAVDRDVEEMIRQEVERDLDSLKANKVKRPEDELFWVLALRVLCERLAKVGRQIMAAAGNDSEKLQGQRKAHDARYPAAFTRVVGVGALPKDAGPDANDNYQASSFSNLADKPPQTGVMALGGEPGTNNGVLGIYIGEFPPEAEDGYIHEYGWAGSGPKSENGWAWWAGTSFATPILTGAVAAVLSGNESPKTTQQAVSALYREGIILDGKTPQKEDVLPSSLMQTVNPADLHV